MEEKYFEAEQGAELLLLLGLELSSAKRQPGLQLEQEIIQTPSGYVFLLMIGDLKRGFGVTFASLSFTSP